MNTEQLVAFIKKNPISTGCALLSVILGLLLYLTSDSVPEAKTQLADLTTQEEKLTANIEYSARLPEQYAALVDANKAIAGRMVKPNQLALNLQYFYKLESDTGLKLTEVHQNPPPPAKGPKPTYLPVGFGLAVDGDYSQVIDILRRLENGPHFCRIDAVTVTSSRSEQNLTTSLHASLGIDLEGTP